MVVTPQIAELKRGAEIIVCTPGRMIDMLGANSGEFVCLYPPIQDNVTERRQFESFLIG